MKRKSVPLKFRLTRISAYLGQPRSFVCCSTYWLYDPLDTVEVWGSSPHVPTIFIPMEATTFLPHLFEPFQVCSPHRSKSRCRWSGVPESHSNLLLRCADALLWGRLSVEVNSALALFLVEHQGV